MIYAALLRGINVGGKNKVSMKQLKEAFERAGMDSVKTYINSGNIIFQDERSKMDMTSVVEAAILSEFGLSIRVLIYTSEEFDRIAEAIPEDWTNDERLKSDVLFLWEQIDGKSVLDDLPSKLDIDFVIYVPGAVLWSIDRKLASKSGMPKIVGSALYRLVTIRNVNTVRKIHELMKAIDG